MRRYVLTGLLIAMVGATGAQGALKKRNIVFVLIDDMRYDAMSLMEHPYLETPAIDSLAKGGVHFRNAFVTMSLCSPSRASFLCGMYAHQHGVLDNQTRLDLKVPTFPTLLQKAGYATAFVGKWHMGVSSNEPRPGFDHWVSFKGQGRYFDNHYNINGETKLIKGYVTDVITEKSTDWLRKHHDEPFMLYMSHKAVHGPFRYADRHKRMYRDVKAEPPASMANTPDNYFRKPDWVRKQRTGRRGVDHGIPNTKPLPEMLLDYSRAMLAIDESIGALVETLKALNLFESTLIVFAADNGFLFGEHGLMSKRSPYEESIRIPWVVSCPELYGQGKVVDQMILNIDLAPTLLEAAGLPIPETMQGQSFLRLPNEPQMKWRDAFLYEYFWEEAYPETPSYLGIRTDRYKYIKYHGVWDTNELYDLKTDPKEMHNRLSTSKRKKATADEGYQETYNQLRQRLRELADEVGVRTLPSWKK